MPKIWIKNMAISQKDLAILKTQNMTDTAEGGGLPTAEAVTDGLSNDIMPDVSDLDRLYGRVRLRKLALAVQTANNDMLQAARMLFTELPDNDNVSVFAFKSTFFADERTDAQNKIESYLAPGSKWAGHLLETQLAGQRVIQISLDKSDPVPAVGQPLVLIQNEGQTDEFYQYIRPIKVDTAERRFQRTVSETVTRVVATIEFGDTLTKAFVGLTVPEFYQNASTTRRAIVREARVADAAKYYSAARLAEPISALQSNVVRLKSIYTQVVPSTQVETPLLQRDPANQVATQARGDGLIEINQSAPVQPNTALNLAGGVAVGTLSLKILNTDYIDRDGEIVRTTASSAVGSIDYSTGQITWYATISPSQTSITGSYRPASEFTRIAQTDYQVVGSNAGYNYTRELGAEPLPNSLKITYTVGGNNYLAHDDGRGNLIDDDGNGRGTVQGKTVLLTAAAIPDPDSYIVYTYGVDLDTKKYGAQSLPAAYHAISIDDAVAGDITITWDDKIAVASNGLITGDASGTFVDNTLNIAPNTTVAAGTVFDLAYDRVTPAGLIELSTNAQPNNADGQYSATFDVGAAVNELTISAELGRAGTGVIKVVMGIAASGTALFIKDVLLPSVVSNGGTQITERWYPMTGFESADFAWRVELLSSSVNKSAGTASYSVRVTRQKPVVDVIARAGVSPLFKQRMETVPMYIANVATDVRAVTSAASEPATLDATINSINIALPDDSASPVVAGSLFFTAMSMDLKDSAGTIKNGTNTVGGIDYSTGIVALNSWPVGNANTVTLKSMLRENDPVPLTNIVFRTPVAPIKEGSLNISVTLSNGTQLQLNTDDQGGITGSNLAHGTVDFKAGFVALYFYERLGVTANPNVVNEPWYDANNIYTLSSSDNTQYINRPVYVKPDSIRYNTIAYSYLPLDKELIGLDPVRLPTDGRVPFVRKGDSVAITEQKTMQLPTSAVGDSFDLGFERLSDVSVVDATGARVTDDELNIDLDAGTLQLNDMFDAGQYTAPLTAKYRIMDIGLCIDTDISGRVTLSATITHDYSTDAVCSSMLVAGDMQALVSNVFSQKSWGGVFSDTLIGDKATIQLQTTNTPIVVTNRDAIEERWALVFTSSTAFRVIGETVGEIGTGSTLSDTSPTNPATGYPYFTVPAAAWSGGGATNNVARFNTKAAKYMFWLGSAIQQHQGSSQDTYDFTIGYHANIDRERGTA